jgi:hypothetical protein
MIDKARLAAPAFPVGADEYEWSLGHGGHLAYLLSVGCFTESLYRPFGIDG